MGEPAAPLPDITPLPPVGPAEVAARLAHLEQQVARLLALAEAAVGVLPAAWQRRIANRRQK